MILFLDTSTPSCHIWLDDKSFEYQTDRNLAKDLLWLINESIRASGLDPKRRMLECISAIIVFRGPGSFTGLRIGINVANTLADYLGVPIIGTTGKSWRTEAQKRLAKGENDKLVLPIYDKPANITEPIK